MKIIEALNILEVSRLVDHESISFDDVKKAYRYMALKYHPDHNPGGLEMMKIINNAYTFLQTIDFPVSLCKEDVNNLAEELNNAINAIINFQDIVIEIVGSWVWVSGETKKVKENLKEAGFTWAAQKKMWCYHQKEEKSRWSKGQDMDTIRSKYGSQRIFGNRLHAIG